MAKPTSTQPDTKTQAHDHNHTHDHNHDHAGHDHSHDGLNHGSTAPRHPEIGENKQVDFTIPWADVEKTYQIIVKKYQPAVKTDGFRKGHAPLRIVEQTVGLERLYQETAEKLLPQAYVDAVKKAGAKPISDPEIHAVKMDIGSDWEFHAHIAEKPEVKLGKYQDVVKKAAKKFEEDQKKAAKPDPKKEPSEANKDAKKPDEQTLKDQKLNEILSALRESIKPVIPELLIKQEAQHQLDQLEQQMKMFNISKASYYKSMGKTEAEVQQEYVGRALASWQLEVILGEIAVDQKTEVSDSEVDEFAATNYPDSKNLTAVQKAQLQAMLRKQKVFDFLLGLN